MPLKPETLAPTGPADWLRAHGAGVASAALGLVSLVVASILYARGSHDVNDVLRLPNPWVTVPLLVASAAAAIASLARREGAYTLAAAGVGVAAIAMALGWAIVIGIVAIATALVMLIVHQLM